MGTNYFISITKEDLPQLIEEAMVDELKVAKGKWRTFLSKEDDKLVLENSRNQLVCKVRSTTKDLDWEIDSTEVKIFPVRNLDAPPLSENIYLPQDARKKDIALLEVNEGWKLDNSNDIGVIPLFEFEKTFIKKVVAWARTAVFYGVASF